MNINIRLGTIAFGLAASVTWAPQLLAGDPAPKVPAGPAVDFVVADKNSDGSITKEEALQLSDLTTAFEMLDSNRDELISRTEFSRWSRAGKVEEPRPKDPATLPSGSAGAQHMPKPE